MIESRKQTTNVFWKTPGGKQELYGKCKK